MRLVQLTPVSINTTGADLLASVGVQTKLMMRSLFIRPVGADIYLVGALADTATDSAIQILDGVTLEVEHLGPTGKLFAKTSSGTADVKLTTNVDASAR